MSAEARPPENATEIILFENKWSIRRVLAFIVLGLSAATALYHLYTGWFGLLQPYMQRLFSLSSICALALFLHPLGRKNWKDKLNWFFLADMVCLAIIILTTVHVVVNFHDIAYIRMARSTPYEVVLGTLYIIIVLELSRRALGWPLVIVVIFFLLQNVFAEQMPSIFYGPPVPWRVVLEITFLADNGIFSTPMMAVADYLIVFLFMVALLTRAGAMKVFVDFALSLTGQFRGGPAKVAVIGSAFMGTISGSPTANVVGTGTFTIPMMKKIGYQPHFAAAVETVSSTGGVITPPVLGITAFLMAEYLGISYWKVCLAAVIPCIVYYTANFMTVHFEALRMGLSGLPKNEIPKLKQTIIKGWPVFIPLLILTYFLAIQYSLAMSALYAIFSFFLISLVVKEYRWTPTKLLMVFEDSGKLFVTVTLACACAGIIIGAFYVSGLGTRTTMGIRDLAAGRLWFALILTAFTALVLGTALPAVATYITLLMIVIPALIKMGANPLAAHFFAFYYGTLSNITPPTCVPAFAAAAIAQANPMKVAFTACRIAIPLFILPFFIPYYPAIVFQGSLVEIITVLITACLGCTAMAAGFEGYSFWGKLNFLERVLMVLGGLAMIVPRIDTSIAGLAAIVLATMLQIFWSLKKAPIAPEDKTPAG